MADEKLVDLGKEYDNLIKNLNRAVDPLSSNIINILSDFTWSYNNTKISHGKNKIPCVYVREFRQSMSSFSSSIRLLSETAINEIKNLKKNWYTPTSFNGSSTKLNFHEYNSFLGENSLLSPYQNLYSLENTNCLKYIFPYYNQIKNNFNINNSWGNSSDVSNDWTEGAVRAGGNILGKFMGLEKNIQGIAEAFDVSGTKGSWADQNIFMELPKFYNYTAEGGTISFKFPLFNNIITEDSIPTWKRNYAFIRNFAIKNLPFKMTMLRYKNPLLYNVIVPGSEYLPVAYVARFNVQSIGNSQTLMYDNGLKVQVPEYWLVDITFKGLINNSANIIAAATTTNINIVDKI